jgi:hypothetical protein
LSLVRRKISAVISEEIGGRPGGVGWRRLAATIALCQGTGPSLPGHRRARRHDPMPAQRLRRKPLKGRLSTTGRLRTHDLASVEEMCDRVIVLAGSGYLR